MTFTCESDKETWINVIIPRLTTAKFDEKDDIFKKEARHEAEFTLFEDNNNVCVYILHITFSFLLSKVANCVFKMLFKYRHMS